MNRQVDAVIFADVQSDTYGDRVGIAVEVSKVESRLVDLSVFVAISFLPNAIALLNKLNAGVIADKVAHFVQLDHKSICVYVFLSREVEIPGETRIRKVCLPHTVTALEYEKIVKVASPEIDAR